MQAWVIFKKKQNGQNFFINFWFTVTSHKKSSGDRSFSTYEKFSKKLIFVQGCNYKGGGGEPSPALFQK